MSVNEYQHIRRENVRPKYQTMKKREKTIGKPVLPPVPRVEIAQIIHGWIGVRIDVKRILLPVKSNEFDGEENGEKGEEEIPGKSKPKSVERNQHVVAGNLCRERGKRKFLQGKSRERRRGRRKKRKVKGC